MRPLKLKVTGLCIFLFVICVPATISQNALPVFELGKNLSRPSEARMTDLATEISYVPLETKSQSLISGIRLIIPAGNDFVVATRDNKIKVFDQNGKYLNDIGRTGKGPGEFGGIVTMFWDEKMKEVIVYNVTDANLIFYTLQGKHLRNFKVPYPAQELYRMQNGTYLGIMFFPVMMETVFASHFLFNTEGMTKPFRPLPFTGEIKVPSLVSYASHSRMGDKDLFIPTRSDTVFVFTGTEMKPFAVVNTNGKMMPDEVYFKSSTRDERSKYITNLSVRYSGSLSFAVDYQYHDKNYCAVCDLATGKIRVINTKSGIVNDLDGGFPFRFAENYSDGCVYFSYDAINMISAQKEGWIQNPGKAYLDLVKKLSENDNPVIVKVKLRDK